MSSIKEWSKLNCFIRIFTSLKEGFELKNEVNVTSVMKIKSMI